MRGRMAYAAVGSDRAADGHSAGPEVSIRKRCVPLLESDLGLGGWVSRRARLRPDDVALRDDAGELSYRELGERIAAVAAGLSTAGVRPGDRVSYSGPAARAYVETLFATVSLGAIFTPVNPRHPAETAASIVADARPRLVIRSAASSVASIEPGPARPIVVTLDGAAADTIAYEDLARSSRSVPTPAVHLDHVALLMFTSGTTGAPKGVMLTHGNVLWDAVNVASVVDIRASDRLLIAASLYRTGGLAIMLQALFVGAAALLPPTVEAGPLLRTIEDWRPTVAFSGPEIFRGLTDTPGWPDADLSSVRLAFAGGSPMLGPLVERYAARGIPFVQGYGMTEAAPLILFADTDSSARRAEAAGGPPLFVDARVVGPDDREMADGEPGELIARGPNVMRGYWGRPDLTAEKLRGGWLRTGDAALHEAAGSIRILGRLDDAIATTGGAVYAGEIELALQGCPEVAEAVAVGLPEGELERPAAGVVLGPGAEVTEAELETRLADRDPRLATTVVVIVPAIPRSAAGKPRRAELRETLSRVVAQRT